MMEGVARAVSFPDIVMNYYTLQLGRCAVYSVLLMALILLLRMALKKSITIKCLLWSLLLTAPFIGRLRIFYEDQTVLRFTRWWIVLCSGSMWMSRLYFAGMAVTLLVLLRQRARLLLFIRGMQIVELSGTKVFVCQCAVTPFTAGVIAPKIVIPEVMLQEYRKEELCTIILHEKTHIRLGHLVYYMIWDILHVLLWINPLFGLCLKYFKEDCEDVCDRVSIKNTGGAGCEYGELLLKTMRLLQNSGQSAGVRPPFAFAGEEEFQRIKRRINTVAEYRKYNRALAAAAAATTAAMIALLLLTVKGMSYARYYDNDDIAVYDMSGEKEILCDSEGLREVISYDDKCVHIDPQGLKEMLDSSDPAENMYAVMIGGFSKIPGYGGGMTGVFIDKAMLENGVTEVPYTSDMSLKERLFKVL